MKSTKQMEIDKNATMTTQEGEGEKEKSGKKSKNKNKEENVKGKETTSNVMVDDHAKSRLEKKEKKKREKKNDTFSGCENERETKKRKKDHMMVYGKETEEKNEKEDEGDKEEEQKKGRMDAMKAENEEKEGKRRKEKKTKDDNEGKNKEKKSKKEKKDDVSNACENEREMKENDNEAFYEEKKEKKAQKNKDDNGEKKKGKKCRKEKKDNGVEANNEEEREESMVKEKKMEDDNEEKKGKKSKKEKKDDNEEKKGKKSKKEKKDDNEEKKGKKTQDDNEEKKGKKRKKEKKDDVLSGCEDEREMKGKKDDIKANKEEKKKRKEKEKKTQDDGAQKKKVKKVRFLDEVEVYPLADSSSKFKKTEEDGLVRGKRFTKEEDEMIKKAVSDYIEANHLGEEGLDMVLHCKRHSKIRNCWKEIATALPWRPYVSIYLRAHALYERGDNKWTPEELQQVREAHAKYGNHWKKTADELGKFRVHVKDAYRRIKLIDMKKGHWSQDEYQTLFELVNKDLQMKLHEEKKSKFGMLRDNISWDAISDKLSTRHNSACCVKWYNQLTSPMVAEGKWSDVDDYKLVMKLVELDASCEDEVNWENLIEYRSADLSRSRWQQMVRHLGVHGTKSFPEQVEVLSQRYCPNMLEVREALDAKPIVDSS